MIFLSASVQKYLKRKSPVRTRELKRLNQRELHRLLIRERAHGHQARLDLVTMRSPGVRISGKRTDVLLLRAWKQPELPTYCVDKRKLSTRHQRRVATRPRSTIWKGQRRVLFKRRHHISTYRHLRL